MLICVSQTAAVVDNVFLSLCSPLPKGQHSLPHAFALRQTHCTFFIGNEGNILAKTRTHMVCRLADVT